MKVCANHPAQAKWHCEFCEKDVCNQCVQPESYKGRPIQVCSDCHGMVAALPASETGPDWTLPEGEMSWREYAVSDPDKRAGQKALAGWMDLRFFLSRDVVTLCVLLPGAAQYLAGLTREVSLIWTIPYGLILFWALGIGIDIMRTSAHGQDRLQDWKAVIPERPSTMEALCRVAILGIGFAPFIVYVSRVTLGLSEEPPDMVVAWLLLLWKDLYMVIAMPAFSVFGTWYLVLPLISIQGLLRIRNQVLDLYLACSVLSLACLGVLALYADWKDTAWYASLVTLAFLVTFLLQSRWIGAFYHRHMSELRWF